jgi:PAS domain S-box-containing protein
VISLFDLSVTSCGDAENRRQGLSRLLDDLASQSAAASDPLPESVREQLLDRIENEPAIVQTDLNGCIVATNPSFSRLCGFAFSEIRGRKPGSFLQGPETSPEAVQEIRTAVAKRLPVSVEMINYHKDGSRYRVSIKIVPITDEHGNVVGFRAVERKLPL